MGTGADDRGGDDFRGEVEGAALKADELLVAFSDVVPAWNLPELTLWVGGGSVTRLGDDLSPLAFPRIRASSRSISAGSIGSSSSSLSMPSPIREVFQEASPVDQRLSSALDGDSRTGRIVR